MTSGRKFCDVVSPPRELGHRLVLYGIPVGGHEVKFKVGHLTYTVHDFHPGVAEDKGLDGLCDHAKQAISVDSSQPPERQAETLLHELLHAAYRVFHLPTEADEETTVTATASALATLFHDNPGLLPVMANGLAGVALNLERA